MVKKKTVAIIQARFNSIRFEGKILKKINNLTLLEILIKRLKKSKKINGIIVACSNNFDDKKIIHICKKLKIKYFIGSEYNLLERYFKAAKKFKIENIVRITSDCPLVDIYTLDNLIKKFNETKSDYASNTIEPTYPDGMDVEVFSFKVLKERYFLSNDKFEIEHVTSEIIKSRKYKKFCLKLKSNFSNLRLTVDTLYDLNILRKLLKYFNYNIYVSLEQVLNLYKKNTKFFEKNASRTRNYGLNLNTGQKYWIRANEIIPGGTMLFSKNPDLFLPEKWPAYFKKSRGCNIWDLENNNYKDLSFMGVGTNILGYSHPKVDKKVSEIIKLGTMTTLNSTEEIKLAEKLIELHPWSDMACFTRSGGEANSVAIRIARAASGRDKIAICGYHGWHDWYLSSNINNPNNLSSHLMQNLPIKGVPKSLKKTVFPFDYNDFNTLNKLVSIHNIGVIKMEVKRNYEPKNNFLQKIRSLANKKNIVLIFDECTSGFRQEFGGLHKHYGVLPDIAVFGKALGNGFAINAIIGKKEVMKHRNSSFISSTFWTERVGPTAALETLKVMEQIKSWKQITKIGKRIKKTWENISKLHKLALDIKGIDAIPNFSIKSKDNIKYKTFITQEMLKKNFLASNAVYCSIAHDERVLNKYFEILESIFYKLSKFENGLERVDDYLETKVCISGLRENIKK